MKSSGNVAIIAMAVALVAPCAGHASSSGRSADLRRKQEQLQLSNRYMTVDFFDGGFELLNHLTGRRIKAAPDTFEIGIEGRDPLTLDSFESKEWTHEKMTGGTRLVRTCRTEIGDVELRVVYDLAHDRFFMRRRLELSSKTPLDLRKVDAWKVKVEGNAAHQGFGEPIFFDDTFWGLEYPAGRNFYRDGEIVLSEYPGRSAKEFVSRTAVMGVASHGDVARKFREYVEAFRVTPNETSLFVNYNTWWTLMPPTEENSLDLIDVFKQRLHNAHGESMDTFTVDMGWEDNTTLWEFSRGFPSGFGRLREALSGMDVELGLWISPSSWYKHSEGLEKLGYQPIHHTIDMCLAAEKYRNDMICRVTELARQNDLPFIKFDGFSSRCDVEGHGHLPGEYAIDANTDSYIALIEAVREVNPDVYLDLTCGMWLSPWWLMYGDSLWGYVGGDYPAPIVPAPVERQSVTTTRDGIFRQRCVEHPGFPPSAIEHLGIIVITPEPWEDNVMAVLGRGCRLLTLYIDPKQFLNADRDWAFMASAMKWARHNAETMRPFEMILGDPMKQEPYGYAHIGPSGGILMVRNPYIEPRSVTIDVDLSDPPAGEKDSNPSGRLIPWIVYPREETLGGPVCFGDSLDLTLQAYETVVIQLEPMEERGVHVTGARCRERSRSGNRMVYEVYGRAGETVSCEIVTGGRTARLLGASGGDETPENPPSANGNTFTIDFRGEKAETKAAGLDLEATTQDGAWRIGGTSSISVPEDSKATIFVLAEPTGGHRDILACTARVNGREVDVRKKDPPARVGWTWFMIDLPSGDSEVSLEVGPVSGGGIFEGELGCWLWVEHKLERRTVALEFDRDVPDATSGPLPMPIHQEYEREVITLQPIKEYMTGEPWPEPKRLSEFDEDVVYLDLAIAAEDEQGWGELQRRQSIWGKAMSIGGRKFARGLGSHANGTIRFILPEGRFQMFKCMVGHDDGTGDNTVVFQVYVDDRKAYDSGPVSRGEPARDVEVDVGGAKALELRCLDGGDGMDGDHCNWADARLTRTMQESSSPGR